MNSKRYIFLGGNAQRSHAGPGSHRKKKSSNKSSRLTELAQAQEKLAEVERAKLKRERIVINNIPKLNCILDIVLSLISSIL